MSRRPKPELRAGSAQALIAEVSASDRQQAREAVAGGVQAAKDQWLEARFIAEALALELVALAQTDAARGEVAAQLRALADALETRADVH